MTTSPTLIVALGSPQGDDRVAWEVARLLEHRAASDLGTVVMAASPWDILVHGETLDRLLVIDACQSSAAPGTVRLWHSLAEFSDAAVTHSTHGGSLSEVLRWATALQRAPRLVGVVTIDIATSSPGPDLTSAVARAIPHAAQLVLCTLGRNDAPSVPGDDCDA